jgi:hypothetical protein
MNVAGSGSRKNTKAQEEKEKKSAEEEKLWKEEEEKILYPFPPSPVSLLAHS